MNKEVRYWKWKSTIIDFNAISDEPLDYAFHPKKKEWVFRYLGIPDNDIHEWYNGGFSSEYNSALKYAKELGLVEDYIDYDDIIYDLKQQLEQRDNIINKAREYIEEYTTKYNIGEERYIDEFDRFASPNKLLEILNIDKGE